MANEEQLNLIKQGVEKWNQWREDNADIKPDLSECDLRQANLQKVNLSYANLNKSKSCGLILPSSKSVFLIQSIIPPQNFVPTKTIGKRPIFFVCIKVIASKSSSKVPKPPGITTKP